MRRAVAVGLLLLHRVARRGRRLLTVHVLLVLRRVRVSATGVDGRRWHWARGPALVRMGCAEVVALVSILVRRRPTERLLGVHVERGGGG